MPSYDFLTCDVFTRERFGGNPLAVFPRAEGITAAQMQAIARELNLSETTFVLPPEHAAHTARVRIFTPGGELPFAGHPTVGTAYALALTGRVPLTQATLVFEEGVGPVAVSVERDAAGAPLRCSLATPRGPARVPAPEPAAAECAALLGLATADVQGSAECWSCGVPFLVVPLASVNALGRARLDSMRWHASLADTPSALVFVVARTGDHWRARMFAPGLGVPEDPATGGAAAAFAGWLAARGVQPSAATRVVQGVEMGRPSEIELAWTAAQDAPGHVLSVQVGGSAVLVSEGRLHL
jgi:trans-2,3-dihydro-3-hydroxyanthranilate isomerase